jgi:hypothetical protein
MIYVYKKSWLGKILIVVMLISAIIWYALRIHNSCEGWELGIGSIPLDNNNGECIIPKPNY